MTLVVGYAADGRSAATIHLAALLARSLHEPVVVAAVVPAAPLPSMARVDEEYREYTRAEAEHALAQARKVMPDDIDATYVVQEARSSSSGLLALAEKHDASLIVLGSSSAGVFGHVALGSVTSRLLYSSPIPVALAPRGFRIRAGDVVTRVTAAYDGSAHQDELVLAAAAVAASVGASLRLSAFAVRVPAAYTTRLGTEGDAPIEAEWTAAVERETAAALKRVAALPEVPDTVESVIGYGRTWAEALDDVEWLPNDVLTIGSSSAGPIARVFLGSRAAKIVRHSPVPVVVVPRSAAERIVDEAEREVVAD
ncbi:universal stress protein [Antrihabitans stalactiti]|uniref:Universal stress protein n=1 Tax=Antrihabitans stalactiti TaxID=2584121 RepID=A0A848KI62_9NOCA|nr:universal stress protein [Antrihabitans stalactiti]NMN95567.1 universal stress protein [Antrihabitans stalactiti]